MKVNETDPEMGTPSNNQDTIDDFAEDISALKETTP
jgi:hypothetical protein